MPRFVKSLSPKFEESLTKVSGAEGETIKTSPKTSYAASNRAATCSRDVATRMRLPRQTLHPPQILHSLRAPGKNGGKRLALV